MKYELGEDGRDKAALEQMLDARTQGRLAMERREEESPPQNGIGWAIASSGGDVIIEEVGAVTGNWRWPYVPNLLPPSSPPCSELFRRIKVDSHQSLANRLDRRSYRGIRTTVFPAGRLPSRLTDRR